MAKMLKFGGPALPEGTHTFYIGKDGREYRANFGAEVDADTMADPDHYVKRGMASPSGAKPDKGKD